MFCLPSPLEKIDHPLLSRRSVELFVKRDDLIHPEISGNKWRKLKYNIEEAKAIGSKKILTLGGAYSNHIAATAVAAREFNMEALAIIRGDELTVKSNPTLQAAHEKGMALKFISRSDYRSIRENPDIIRTAYPDHFFIPEGGANARGAKGCAEIVEEITVPFHCIISALGTGTTLAGLTQALKPGQSCLGINVLRNPSASVEISSDFPYLKKMKNWSISEDYHFGGYGKNDDVLVDFINSVKSDLGILFDPIYTGKAFYGVWEMISSGIFDDQTLIFLHTGGLQGIAGFNQKSSRKIHI